MNFTRLIPWLMVTICLILSASHGSENTAPVIKVAPMNAVGPRPVEAQTQASVVRDYLQAWQSLDRALRQNRVDVLDGYFVGVARDKLADTVRQQQALGIETAYRDVAHDIQVAFYSPEGLSIQILDTVEYDMDVRDQGKTVGTQHVRTRYVSVLTPTESRWKVRVLQAGN